MKARSVLSCKYFDLKGFLLDIYIHIKSEPNQDQDDIGTLSALM